MYILSIIRKYVELEVKKLNLEQNLITIDEGIRYAQVEGDIAYNHHEYTKEKGYNQTIRNYQELKHKTKNNLNHVKNLLKETTTVYKSLISKLTKEEIKELLSNLTLIIEAKEIKLEELIEKQNIASNKGDEAYNNRNYQEEAKYNKIVTECYLKEETIKKEIVIYNNIITELYCLLDTSYKTY